MPVCGEAPGLFSAPRQRGEEDQAGGPTPQPFPGI